MNIAAFHTLIKKSNLQPRSIDEDNAKQQKKENDERKQKWSKSFFARASLNEIMKGGKMVLDAWGKRFKEGNEINAARFAARFSKWFPGMQTQYESVQKKKADEFTEYLKNYDSKAAVDVIANLLKIKNLPSYQLEGALSFMLTKF
jgi:hypothetical protein